MATLRDLRSPGSGGGEGKSLLRGEASPSHAWEEDAPRAAPSRAPIQKLNGRRGSGARWATSPAAFIAAHVAALPASALSTAAPLSPPAAAAAATVLPTVRPLLITPPQHARAVARTTHTPTFSSPLATLSSIFFVTVPDADEWLPPRVAVAGGVGASESLGGARAPFLAACVTMGP